MKRIKLIGILFGFIGIFMLPAISLPAQKAPQEKPASKEDKVKSLEILYISRELDLTPEEAQKFWPVYKRYSEEVNQLIAERRKKNKELKSNPRTDALASEALDKELGFEKRMVDIKTRYKQEFLKVLPAAKVTQLYRAEREFRSMMIRQLKERREHRDNDNRR
ncbi:hypothetical protein WJU16_15695 [Chitinophaga pollutisoli]|uniref:Sensor of ECF-type sigma factor n=1 Tax=Chitinophaga pollutisoli TaxID=3133966 RepID=A0ABZ2YIA4_9BACT